MGTRVPIQHYGLRSSNSFAGSSLHDLNTVDSCTGKIEGIVQCDSGTDEALGNDEESVDCLGESYRNSLPPLHNACMDEVPSAGQYDMLTIEDITPIETSRARFLDLIVNNFINKHIVEAGELDVNYARHSVHDSNVVKKISREIQYEGDSRFVLPLMYVANMYETLVNDVNTRLILLSGMREKTIGVALEAAGGLYRKLAQKFPRKGPCTFKRRELATSVDTRTRFPELVIQEEKRVRFVVVNGLDIVEKPNNVSLSDAQWFKRLTGRTELCVSDADYKFYSPRHKIRRPPFSAYPGTDNSSIVTRAQEFCSLNEQQEQQQNLEAQQHSQNFSLVSHIAQDMPCLRPNHILVSSPAKFCDECGSPYMRDVSKFCSECGTKRLGVV